MVGNIKILGDNSEQDSQRDLGGEDQEANGKEISTREWPATSNCAVKLRNPRAGTSWVK